MIVTLTPRPSLDRILTMQSAARGNLTRSAYSILEPGGEGIHVTRALLAHGARTTAVLPIGGAIGQAMALLLTDTGVPFAPVATARSLPLSTTIVEADGATTTFHEAGPTLNSEETSALLARTDDQLHDASWLALCGPLATGLPQDFYATAIRRAHTYGTQVAVSAHGEAMGHALAAGPDLVYLSGADLAEVLHLEVSTREDAHRAGEGLVRGGIPTVVITLDTGDAMLLTDRGSWHAHVVAGEPTHCPGATSAALLAGVLHALEQGAPTDQAMAQGAAWANATRQQAETQPHRSARQVRVHVTTSPGSGGTPSRAA